MCLNLDRPTLRRIGRFLCHSKMVRLAKAVVEFGPSEAPIRKIFCNSKMVRLAKAVVEFGSSEAPTILKYSLLFKIGVVG